MKSVPQVLNSENLVGKQTMTATEIAKYLDNFREMLGEYWNIAQRLGQFAWL